MKIVDEFIQRIASTGIMLSLGDGIVDTFVSACLSEEKWITIGGKQEGDEKHVGGFKVKIDGEGNIVKGRMKGTNVKDIKAKFDEKKTGKKKDKDSGTDNAKASVGNDASIKNLSEVYPEMPSHIANRLIKYQSDQANQVRKKQGLKPVDYDLKLLPLNDIHPSQHGDDYENDSSRYTAKHIGKYNEDHRKEDYAPVAVDENMNIIDGNHRHAARKMAGITTIPVLVPKHNEYAKFNANGKSK